MILRYNLKNNPNALELARIIFNKELFTYQNTVMLAEIILKFNLKDNHDAILIANMVCKTGISLDLAMEVSKYNHENYKFNQFNEKYEFHKLRQLYQIKIQTEPNFNTQTETERIMRTIGIDSLKAKYLLISCLGDNRGRNSSFYWDYNQYKDDFNNIQSILMKKYLLLGVIQDDLL